MQRLTVVKRLSLPKAGAPREEGHNGRAGTEHAEFHRQTVPNLHPPFQKHTIKIPQKERGWKVLSGS